MRVAVVGATGQLGRALAARLGPAVVWAGGSQALDVRDPDAVRRVVVEARPDVVINASAYNDVDGAESHVDEAFAVNAIGAGHLARACREVGALLVHLSTDYVFDGLKAEPYDEEDLPRPLNVYGVSKLAGSLLVSAAAVPHVIVRTSGVFGTGGSRVKGGSFVERIVSRARAGQPLRVVADQRFSPTYAPDLAAALLRLVESGARGVFHVTNAGECTWYELAAASVELAGLRTAVEAIRTAELPRPARRPAYSVLSNARYCGLGLPPLRHWKEALRELLR